ncbi:MAG: apolipoprotein N-acyltransferase [Candidatus Omnitrophica bacterium]|nr:apolipoprotein N-acyltransferase [Candidatus Omnitrophota bacterium]
MLRRVRSSKFQVSGFKIKDVFLCLLSAVLLILSFPRTNWYFLAWFAFVPVFFSLKDKTNKQAFLLFLLTGIIFWSGIIYWLVHVTLLGTIVLVLYLSLYFAFFGLLIRPFTRKSKPYGLILISSIWVLLEYIRSYALTGFPWALLGYSQYLNLPVIQIADIFGVWGVSFLVMMVNVGLVEIIWSIKTAFWARLKITAVILGLFLVSTLLYGFFHLFIHVRINTLEPIKISVVQPNIPQELKWDVSAQGYIFETYSKLTSEAAKEKPDLIIWPEASCPGVLGEDEDVLKETLLISQNNKVPLVVGAVRKDGEDYFNSAAYIVDGKVIGFYDKLHRVPFGEYIPLKDVFPFLETVAPIGEIKQGKEFILFRLLKNKPTDFGVLICFEDLFPELSREFVKKGASFLINITNDAWYKETSAPYQHLQASVFRAVENRVALVRSTNTGVSAFIDPYGRIVSTVHNKNGQDIFISGVDTRITDSLVKSLRLYVRFGDFFPAVCLFLALCGIIILKKP